MRGAKVIIRNEIKKKERAREKEYMWTHPKNDRKKEIKKKIYTIISETLLKWHDGKLHSKKKKKNYKWKNRKLKLFERTLERLCTQIIGYCD